ncbi:MAG TPA: hypothetical protein VFB38_08140 [Chthonomonadaceae bacterium]|nr:hypothetical protein [Chthonomonadaceae bacterium]
MFRGVYTAPPTEKEGIQMIYMPDRQLIRMDGWYNGRQGTLQPIELPLGDLLRGLGITLEDCRQALASTQSATAQTATENLPQPSVMATPAASPQPVVTAAPAASPQPPVTAATQK